MSEDKVRFVLHGPNAGKTIGFCKDLNGKRRFNFVEGVMEMHRSRVNGRVIFRLQKDYSAYLEGQGPEEKDNGGSDIQEPGSDGLGSKEVDSQLTSESTPAPGSDAIELGPNAGAESPAAEREAGSEDGSSTKAAGKRKPKKGK